MSNLKIRNFGPINEGFLENDGWLELRKVTVFIGNQGSGKSTVAKLFSTLTWIEKAMVRGQLKPAELSSPKEFQRQLKYQRIDNYLRNTSEIEYKGRSYHLLFRNGALSVQKATENGYQLPKIMYVPAERNFLSVVDRPDTLKNLPSPLFTFLDEYDSARNLYSSGISLPIGEAKFQYDPFHKIAHLAGDNYTLRLSEASSGFQSTIPLYLVTKYLTESLRRADDPAVKPQSIEEQRRLAKEIERIMSDPALSEEVRQESLRQLSSRYTPSCFINIVEEPEQNLFPDSQQKILHSLLACNNSTEGNMLLMTTHSPYLVNYLSIAVQGAYLKEKLMGHHQAGSLQERMEKIIPQSSVVPASELIIYQFDEAVGVIRQLPTPEGIPSDNNYLNQSLRHGNDNFDELLAIEQEL